MSDETALPIFDVHHLSIYNNPFAKTNPDDPMEMIRMAEKLYPKNKALRDLQGKFAPDDGIDYVEFDRNKHVREQPRGPNITRDFWQSSVWLSKHPKWHNDPSLVRANPNYRFPNIMGLDLGNTWMSACIMSAHIEPQSPGTPISPAMFNHVNTSLHVVEAIQDMNTNVVEYERKQISSRFPNPNDVIIFLDPFSADRKGYVDGVAPVDYLRKCGYVVFYKHGKQLSRELSCLSVNMRFRLDRLTIHPRCATLIKNLIKFKSDNRTQKAISADPDGQLPDALKYAVSFIYPFRDLLYENQNDDYYKALREIYGQVRDY